MRVSTNERASTVRVTTTSAQEATAQPLEAPRPSGTKPNRGASGTAERRKGRRRSRTIPMRQLTREELIQGAELTDLIEYERPQSRADCKTMHRPCPFVSCRYHLYLEVNEDTGSIKLNFPDVELTDLPETCALDVADRGGVTLEEIGEILNLTRERIRQVESRGLEQLRELGFKEDILLDQQG
jgi:hypothetical protein